ncbi:hypothetical protein FOCC_FOCC001162 [Frankliniella occidentalis]|uniref:Protein MAK10 homolog n=1 Tax=Frankliniella occidentalis TaxID=133901 RepID=A0A6J1T9Z6_FRAOC|nr:N-alpha-acetyltransferase 35, NatC auxiliary subunit [Frankliniella occidentalis]KAE8751999.1 hypothetical protein FOCC_FOCC001162 [Frankliniella occidentalis]
MSMNEHIKVDDDGDLSDDEKKKLLEDGVFTTTATPKLTYNWVDITEEFTSLAKTLNLGELLLDKHFGLYEAMSAVEMMDPKMDAGMMCNRSDKPTLTFDKGVELGVLRLEGLDLLEQIGVMDQVFACFVSWIEGNSLAQTVFANLYLHKPFSIEERSLKAFCITAYKMVEIIKHFIDQAAVFEEEDYQPMQYGYRLVPDVSEQRTVGMLREVEEDLFRRLRQRPPQREADCLGALLARIKFIRLLYSVLGVLGRQDTEPEARKELRPESELHKALNMCSEQLTIMRSTIPLAIPSDSPKLGFEPLANQRLLPPTFPRYAKIKSRDEAFTYYDDLIQRLRVVCKIYSHASFHTALDFFMEFSRQKPCLLSRSVLQVLYIPQPSSLLTNTRVVEVLREAAKSFICPPSLASKTLLASNTQAKEFLDMFLLHCGRPFVQLIQLCGHNRARQRERLAHLLEDFSNLQDEAEKVDAYLHNLTSKSEGRRSHLACFGTWILYHTLRIMIMYLLSGFELQLYSVHEYHYIYWYLYEFLYGWLLSSLSRADSLLLEQESYLEKENSRGKGKKNKVKRKKGCRPYARDITLCQVYQNLCGGYYKAAIAFQRTGKINIPKSEFDCEKVRYEHRFLPFSSLHTPPPMQYTEFCDMTKTMETQICVQSEKQSPDHTRLFMAACKNFHQARTLLEIMASSDQEINNLLLVAKTNFVVLKLLAGGHKQDSNTPPIFDFSQHCHFPIIKLN